MAQGSRMHLQLESSPKGLAACATLYLLLALLLLQAEFSPAVQMLTQSLLAWAGWSGYRSTAGLGLGGVT